MICANCRVEVAESRARGWVHIEPVPDGVKDHEIVPASPEEVEEITAEYRELDSAKLRVGAIAVQMAEHPEVSYTDVARDAVTLLVALRNVEKELAIAYGEPV